MKKENRTRVIFIAVLTLITLGFWACKDDMNKTGYDLLLPGDKINVYQYSVPKESITAYTVKDDLLRTTKPGYNLLGTLVDPIFGKTTADFAVQLRLTDTAQYLSSDVIDSVVFIIKYNYFYGYHEEGQYQNFKVYEFDEELNADDTTGYYQDKNLKALSKSEILGQIDHYAHYTPVETKDPEDSTKTIVTDTVATEISIRLEESFGRRLMALTDSAIKTNEESPNKAFTKMLKGLYIEANDINEGGAIMRVAPFGVFMYTRKTLTTPKQDQVTTYFEISKLSANINRFEHYNYDGTTFRDNLDKPNQPNNLLYLQTTGGLSSKIFIPSLSNWKDSLYNKIDSVGFAINKAELVLQVDQGFMDTLNFTPPYKLILGLINKNGEITGSDGQLIYPTDLTLSESYYGGIYNKEDGTYRFNLAGHLQNLIRGKVENYGFYLTTNNKNTIMNRVVLKGATNNEGIRFNVTYSKIK